MEAVGLGKMSTGVSLRDTHVRLTEANHGTLTPMQIHTMHILILPVLFTLQEVPGL